MNEVAKIAGRSAPETVHAFAAQIERICMNPDIPLDRLEKMLDMKERLDAKTAEQAFNAAFAAASAEFPAIPMNGKGHNQRPYALLKDIINLTRPVLSAHGLSLNWDVQTEGGVVRVTARLKHTGGHQETTQISLAPDTSGSKAAPQAVGSSQTYGQRYTAQAILGLSLGDDVDDDAETVKRGATISADQFIALRDEMEELGADEAAFCKHLKIEALDFLPVARLPDARAALATKRAKMNGGK